MVYGPRKGCIPMRRPDPGCIPMRRPYPGMVYGQRKGCNPTRKPDQGCIPTRRPYPGCVPTRRLDPEAGQRMGNSITRIYILKCSLRLRDNSSQMSLPPRICLLLQSMLLAMSLALAMVMTMSMSMMRIEAAAEM